MGKPLTKGLRWVPIIPDGGRQAIAPTLENIVLGKYPLQVSIRWLISPKASDTCKSFVAYVCGKEVTSILEDGAIFPGRAKVD